MKKNRNDLEVFLIYVLPPVILIFGLVGNFLIFIVFSRHKFSKLRIKNIFRLLAVLDTFGLTRLVFDYMKRAFDFDVRLISNELCRFFTFYNDSVGSISAWLLVYMSVERLISVRFTKFSFCLRNPLLQFIIILFIMIMNICLYLIMLYTKIDGFEPECQNPTSCKKKLQIFDFVVACGLPFLIMLFASILMLVVVYRTRRRISFVSTTRDNKKFKKKIHFALLSMLLNLAFFLTNAPISVYTVVIEDHKQFDIGFVIMVYIYYLSNAIHFYIFIFGNVYFRREIRKIFKLNFKNKFQWEKKTSITVTNSS